MSLLIVGLLIFFAVHLVPTVPSLRNTVINRLGEGSYKGVYSVIAAVGLVLIIWGKARAGFVPLWEPPSWGRTAAFPLVLAGLILLGASHMPGNIKRLTRHPMLWGITLWALAHLSANGDLASLLLFGSFLLYSLVDILSASSRGIRNSLETQPLHRDAMTVMAGAVVFAVFLFLHPYLFGVRLIG